MRAAADAWPRLGQGTLAACRTVAVTGGLGFVGRHLVSALSALGKEVTVVDTRLTLPKDSRTSVRRIGADIRNLSEVAHALKGVDVVFHLAANASGSLSVEDPPFDFQTNATGTFNVAYAAAMAGVRKFVYLSSASVYGKPGECPINEGHPLQPFLPYGASKLAGELACYSLHMSHGLRACVARSFVIYGPGEDPRSAEGEVSRFLRWQLNKLPIQVVGNPQAKTRDFVHVSDVVEGLLIIADRAEPGETFNVGSGTETTMSGLVRLIGQATHREAKVEVAEDLTDDTYRLVADVSKLETLGYVCRTSLADGVAALARSLGASPQLPGRRTNFRRVDGSNLPRTADAYVRGDEDV